MEAANAQTSSKSKAKDLSTILNKSNLQLSNRVNLMLKKKASKKLADVLDVECRPRLPVKLPPLNPLRQVTRESFPEIFSGADRNMYRLSYIEGDDDDNPFKIPSDIVEFNRNWDEDLRREKKEEEKINPLLKITASFKQAQIVLARTKPFMYKAKETEKRAHDNIEERILWKAQHGMHITHLQKVSKSTHAEYIRQRRTIFYLNRAVKIRREALRLLHDKKIIEEKKIEEYESLVAFTKETFENFLRENDDATMAATREAQAALKEKLDKSMTVRNINVELNSLKSEISVINESLKECKSYMKFLDDIAREIMRKDEEEQNRLHRREQQIKEEIIKYMKQGSTLKEAQEKVEQNAREFSEDQHGGNDDQMASSGSQDFIAALNDTIHGEQMYASSPIGTAKGKTDSETDEDSKWSEKTVKKGEIDHFFEDDGFDETGLLTSLELVGGDAMTDRQELLNMSFTRPSQLLQIYSDMEEANLSLIQHCQTSEEHLERLNSRIRATRQAMNQRGRVLRSEINNVECSIDLLEGRSSALSNLIQIFTGGNYDVKKQQKLYRLLRKHVGDVYKEGVGTVDQHLNPLMMLTSIEKNFEDLMREIENVPTDVVLQISRELDKERREAERIEKLNQRQKVQDERKTKALSRAKAPATQKRGRPLLARSRPPKVVIQLAQSELDKKAEEDEFNYFFGE